MSSGSYVDFRTLLAETFFIYIFFFKVATKHISPIPAGCLYIPRTVKLLLIRASTVGIHYLFLIGKACV